MDHIATLIEQARPNGQDRLRVCHLQDITLLLLADGAGGSDQGTRAADLTIRLLESELTNVPRPADLLRLESTMRDIDRALAGIPDAGQTTGLAVVITPTEVAGVSVGDSQCWGFSEGIGFAWTAQQYTRRLLGTGEAVPIAFGPFAPQGCILFGSDGLFGYSTPLDRLACIQEHNIHEATQELAALTRLPNGSLRDDLSIGLVNFDLMLKQ